MLTQNEQEAVDLIKQMLEEGPTQVNIGYHGNKSFYIFMPDRRRPLVFNMSDRLYDKLLNNISNFFQTEVGAGRIDADDGLGSRVDEVNEVVV